MLAASFDCSVPQAVQFIAACTAAVLLVRFAYHGILKVML